jgi:hypothetical protein
MWAALIAINLCVLLKTLSGIDTNGWAHCGRLRRELLCIPARVIRHAGQLEMRLPPDARACSPKSSPGSARYHNSLTQHGPRAPTKDLGPSPDTASGRDACPSTVRPTSLINNRSEHVLGVPAALDACL